MQPESLREFIINARSKLAERSEEYTRVFGLAEGDSYQWSMEPPELVWLDVNVPRVWAGIQCAGTLSVDDGTWLWSWANDAIPDGAKSRMKVVRDFGREHSWDELTEEEWEATEEDAADMTAVAAMILNARGVFREECEDLGIYFVLTDLRHVG